jgi:hypothetical protein
MLQSVNDLKGYDIIAADGEIGSIEEFYFDDEKMTVRYLVANTGNWLTGKQQLISPQAITHLDREKRNIHVSLTKEQVKQSPGIDKHQPVSRQMERIISDYYGDPMYWDERPNLTAAQLATANADSSMIKASTKTGSAAAAIAATPAPDVHLRSMQEVTTYHIAALDGEIGQVEDFFVETDDWSIRYIGIDTHHILSGKHVLISTLWLGQINWAQRKVDVSLTRTQIENSPDYDKVTEISREYETRLHKHYDQQVMTSSRKTTNSKIF